MRLYHGDCVEKISKIKHKIDLVLVDLPYGQTNCEWDVKIDLIKMWIELKKVCKQNCIFIFFCTTKFGNELINSNPKWFRYDLVWEKNKPIGFFNAKKQPLRIHEMIYVFSSNKKSKGLKCTYNPQQTKGKMKKEKVYSGKRTIGVYGKEYSPLHIEKANDLYYPKSILKFKKPSINTINHTQKPVDLCEWLVKSYSNEGDWILDFTMGGGSTGVACINTNRKFIGIEKDKEMFLKAENRLIKNLKSKIFIK